MSILGREIAITITVRETRRVKVGENSWHFVLAYGSGFKTYPLSSHFPLIFCLCPCHCNQMINGAFYGYSGKYIIQTFIGHEAQREYAHFSLQDFDEEILLFTLSNRSHLFINMKTEKTLLWPDLVFISPCQLQVACEYLMTLVVSASLKEWNSKCWIPTQEISLQLLSEATRLYLALHEWWCLSHIYFLEPWAFTDGDYFSSY